MTRIAVIGANGYLGRLISARLEAEGADFVRVTSRQQDAEAPGRLVWTYAAPPPAALSEAGIWINCAFRLSAGAGNLALVRHLLAARTDQRFVQISTNATLGYPEGAVADPPVQRRGGEDYARIKSAIDRALQAALPAEALCTVYPTAIIGDDSNWDRALTAMAGRPRLHLPGAGALRADWVASQEAVSQILAIARAGAGPRHLVLRSQPAKSWADLVRDAAEGQGSGAAPEIADLPSARVFFDSALKDRIFSVLCHPALPDGLALRLFGALRKRLGGTQQQAASASAEPFVVTGPTRFYMAQDASRIPTPAPDPGV